MSSTVVRRGVRVAVAAARRPVPVLRCVPCAPMGTYNRQGSDMGAMWQDGPFRSNAEVLIDGVPVIEVEGMTAVCNGGGGALGHPIEYIQLNTARDGKNPMVEICKYCGLRFIHKAH
eukprot:CAMPEP_0205920968 /NCGR_PEP_ID=MMETSP1325-20131115/12056_1 /ASSEMBLY_ACC=CAM_ASM_000708 /TAXON_ID=236786 /ORGANISM="Florenciella sp., Strain RCC1007" /LENGTH=116 /DNA_ID=CAMNT_0053288719 /DNA_START=11 /DNA_END=361 /DNA_ORIENTATION=+